MVIDLTAILPIHWPTSQAMSLQNIVFKLSDAPGTLHQGLFIESGSAGFVNDLVFDGGAAEAVVGNYQYTMRNLSVFNSVMAIQQLWDWGWTYQSVQIENCSVGLNFWILANTSQAMGSVTFFNSFFEDTAMAFKTSHSSTSTQTTGGSLLIEKIEFSHVSVIVQGPSASVILKGSEDHIVIKAGGHGYSYTPNGPTEFESPFNLHRFYVMENIMRDQSPNMATFRALIS